MPPQSFVLRFGFALVVGSLGSGPLQGGDPLEEAQRSNREVAGILERYSTDRQALERRYAVPMSQAYYDRLEKFYRQWQTTVARIDHAPLSPPARVDLALLRNHLTHELAGLLYRRDRDVEVTPLLPFWKTIVEPEEARRRMDPADPVAAAERLDQLAQELEERTEKIEELGSEVKPTVAHRAARRADDLVLTLERWFRFYDGYDPVFSWWARNPYERAHERLSTYAQEIRMKLVGTDDRDAIIGDPIGREALQSELEYEMIAYSPEELIEIANREFEWCRAEMRKASQELGFEDDWRAALDHVKSLHVEPGEQPRLIRDLAWEAVEFLEKHELVTIPPLCKEIWRMRMMSPQRQKMTPYFTGGEVISVSFPTDSMEHPDKLMSLRGNNIHFSRATVHHELIPGHHLQGFMVNRYQTQRQLFHTPFWLEGWALYWELLLWDRGFARSAEDRVGMLFWRTHRCARIIFSLSFHLERMTAEECVDFLVENVGHERRNAQAEVRRSVSGDYGPLYQCAYMIGGLQFRALHRELVGSSSMTDRAFHDAILRENSIPISMVRAILLGLDPDRAFREPWRFYPRRRAL